MSFQSLMVVGRCLKTKDKRYFKLSELSFLGNKITGKEQKQNENKLKRKRNSSEMDKIKNDDTK